MTPDRTFHLTEKNVNGIWYKAGDVYRMNDYSSFVDGVILGISEDCYVRIARPYLYASLIGTTCASALMGYEQFDIPVEHLYKYWKYLDNGRCT